MKLGIMQPYFFPYIGYWQLIYAVDEFVIYDDVSYIKNGWINRNNILLSSQKHILTLPLIGASSFLPINQIKMIDNIKMKNNLIKTIEQAYKKAPYFNDVIPIIHDTILYPSDKIIDALYYSIMNVSKYLNISTKIFLSSSLEKDNTLNGQEKIIHICKLLKARQYINAIGGMDLYDKKSFLNEGINLYFLKSNEIIYKQYDNEFIPLLSIIDILMFNDKKTVQNYLNNFALI